MGYEKNEDRRVVLGGDNTEEIATDERQGRGWGTQERYLNQVEMALPVNNSPDRQLCHLHQQEEEFVKTGKFL